MCLGCRKLECLQQSLLGFEAMIFNTRYIITHLYNHTQAMHEQILFINWAIKICIPQNMYKKSGTGVSQHNIVI